MILQLVSLVNIIGEFSTEFGGNNPDFDEISQGKFSFCYH